MMEMYYIVDQKTWEENLHHFTESHYLALPEEGKILLCAVFRSKTAENNFRSLPGVDPLPHPISGTKIHPRHVKALAHLGVDETHNTMNVAEKAAKQHVLMRFTGI